MVVDCITFACTGAPAASSGRRELGHGGGSAVAAPAGWRPDPSMPYVSGNDNFCDMTKLVNPATIAGGDYLAMVAYIWVITCSFIPRTSEPFTKFTPLGFKGLIWVNPCQPKGCLISAYANMVAQSWSSNPDPALPICISANGDANNPTGFVPGYNAPADEDTVQNFIVRQWASPGMEVWVECTEGSTPNVRVARSASFKAIFVIYGVFHLLLVGITTVSVYRRYKSKMLCSWTTFVSIVEGIISSCIRAWRCFTGEYFYNANTTIDNGNWFLTSAETPFSIATTFVTAMVWLKLICLSSKSSTVSKAFNFVTGFGALVVFSIGISFGMIYPFQPWLSLNFSSGQQVRDLATLPVVYTNMALVAVFTILSATALGKMLLASKRTSSSSISNAVRKMLKYIALQVVGLVLQIVSFYQTNEYTNILDSVNPDYFIWYICHLRELGGLFAGYGQVLALLTSSSSSSTSA